MGWGNVAATDRAKAMRPTVRGTLVMDLLRKRHSAQILTRKRFENAIAAVAATGVRPTPSSFVWLWRKRAEIDCASRIFDVLSQGRRCLADMNRGPITAVTCLTRGEWRCVRSGCSMQGCFPS